MCERIEEMRPHGGRVASVLGVASCTIAPYNYDLADKGVSWPAVLEHRNNAALEQRNGA